MISNFIGFEDGFRVYPVRGYHGMFHLLHDPLRGKAVLIDTGLVGEMSRLFGVLGEIGRAWGDIEAILLTHGHLDHTGNLARVRELTGAPVWAHALEQLHIDGTFPYQGASRVCGMLEGFGRWALRYRRAPIDQPLVPDAPLPFWGGLRVMHLPGHTAGHCGFYSERFSLLFSGDLFANYRFSTHLPPPFLNSCPKYFPGSLRKVRELSPRYVIPNHYDRLDGEYHRWKFDELEKSLALKNERRANSQASFNSS